MYPAARTQPYIRPAGVKPHTAARYLATGLFQNDSAHHIFHVRANSRVGTMPCRTFIGACVNQAVHMYDS